MQVSQNQTKINCQVVKYFDRTQPIKKSIPLVQDQVMRWKNAIEDAIAMQAVTLQDYVVAPVFDTEFGPIYRRHNKEDLKFHLSASEVCSRIGELLLGRMGLKASQEDIELVSEMDEARVYSIHISNCGFLSEEEKKTLVGLEKKDPSKNSKHTICYVRGTMEDFQPFLTRKNDFVPSPAIGFALLQVSEIMNFIASYVVPKPPTIEARTTKGDKRIAVDPLCLRQWGRLVLEACEKDICEDHYILGPIMTNSVPHIFSAKYRFVIVDAVHSPMEEKDDRKHVENKLCQYGLELFGSFNYVNSEEVHFAPDGSDFSSRVLYSVGAFDCDHIIPKLSQPNEKSKRKVGTVVYGPEKEMRKILKNLKGITSGMIKGYALVKVKDLLELL